MRIEFEKERHLYKIDGKPVPSVSRIIMSAGLADFGNVEKSVLERAGNFGTAVHRACELNDQDNLDHDSLSEHLVPYLIAWQNFISDTGFVSMESEKPIASKKWGFAGTPDRVGILKKLLAIVDIKTNAVMRPECALQTAGYKIGYEEMTGQKIKKRLAVHLKPDGKYSLHIYPNPIDEAVFLSAVNIYRWKQSNIKGEKR